MQIIKSPIAMLRKAEAIRRRGKSIGLVPTMGALHEGHLSLIRRSVKDNDFTIVSIFVNPAQFAPNEDLTKYPRAFKADCHAAQKVGADFIFHPSVSDIYPTDFQTHVVPGDIAEKLEGAARPGHFRGVATICLKLFNITKPHRAYFGQKDAQQLAVIKKMVADLNLDLKIVGCPIVRTDLGVAMSSRHAYLSEDELSKAAVIHKSLKAAEKEIKAGQKSIAKIHDIMTKTIESQRGLTVEYISFNRWDDLVDVSSISGKIVVSLVVRIGKVRLLDNIIINTCALLSIRSAEK
jgi:pantoate--beta-alanine ligase